MKAKIAIVPKKDGKFEMKDAQVSEPAAHEVLIKITATGLCHTDLSVKAGNLPSNFPVVLGHEGAGVVEKVGSHVSEFEKGDHVVLS